MKYYLFIFATKQNSTHIGTTTDPIKTVDFYNAIPNINLDGSKVCRLVYLADANEETVKHYFETLTRSPKQATIDFVNSLNPNWQELIIGQNIHLS